MFQTTPEFGREKSVDYFLIDLWYCRKNRILASLWARANSAISEFKTNGADSSTFAAIPALAVQQTRMPKSARPCDTACFKREIAEIELSNEFRNRQLIPARQMRLMRVLANFVVMPNATFICTTHFGVGGPPETEAAGSGT
jgi:hypothetical protein